ncbi:MAG: hypothetical protein HW407_1206 [Bacteroidetes bacterium]|nr:hypothetical protein [Bacteroidota bacterium]
MNHDGFIVPPGKKIRLLDYSTGETGKSKDKKRKNSRPQRRC